MKNEKFFLNSIKEASKIRKQINNIHHKKMNNLSTLFKLIYNKDADEFIYAKNILYYKGGWPSESTPARAQTLANHIANAYIILSYLNMNKELDFYLKERGLAITVINESLYRNYFKINITDPENNSKYKKVLKIWKEIFGSNFIPNSKLIIEKLMNEALSEQKIICELADEIKINKGEEVKSKCEIKNVHNFTNLVNFEFNHNEGKDVDEKIENGKEKLKESDDCLETYKKSL